ncbi:hypothetical protein DFR86_04745 [Acidianus sulfidivorans JP7]|uniref:Uncharacterized protein n=1 Tax=Acidianus sulfidivorans JP7 TaxID=619593 RepID=A0A2U9ILZ6_9CREN|nr:hypothetical protein [Acidianus sulfidivorans]AWR96934.1 hypothetical protein DFR86_04745 [Acidianus sulfidivorans JP7]
MNLRMWGPILAGGIIEAIAVLVMVGYGFSFMHPDPAAFAFSYGTMDYLGIILALIGLALIMVGGSLKK